MGAPYASILSETPRTTITVLSYIGIQGVPSIWLPLFHETRFFKIFSKIFFLVPSRELRSVRNFSTTIRRTASREEVFFGIMGAPKTLEHHRKNMDRRRAINWASTTPRGSLSEEGRRKNSSPGVRRMFHLIGTSFYARRLQNYLSMQGGYKTDFKPPCLCLGDLNLTQSSLGYAVKSFRNLIKSTWNQIVFPIFRLI